MTVRSPLRLLSMLIRWRMAQQAESAAKQKGTDPSNDSCLVTADDDGVPS